MLNLQRLRVLLEVERHGSLSGAARALSYTQPAVSHHLAALESETGTAMVARAGRGVRLTEAGHALAHHAEAILARVELDEDEVAALAGLRAGRARLVTFPSATATVVPGALAALRTQYPGIAVSLVEAEPPEALKLLRAGEVDLALAFEYPEVAVDEGADFEKRVLGEDPLVAVLPEGHALADGDGPLALAELAGETWIAGCERCRGHLVSACEAAGFQPRIAFATDDYLAVQRLVAAGLGVCLLPGLTLRLVTLDGVVTRAVAERPARRVTAILPAGARRPPAVGATLDALVEAFDAVATERGPGIA
jgi:DNA-binding transcriptional LysR family regulator